MDIDDGITILGALAQINRLKLFRFLVPAGTDGVRSGDLAAAFGMSPAAMTHHLKEMQSAGLLRSRRSGREIFYSVDIGRMRGLIGFLIRDCCQGHPELCLPELAKADGADPTLTTPGTWAVSLPPGYQTGRKHEEAPEMLNVLYISRRNAARSIIAEAMLNHIGGGDFRAYSAGADPADHVDPMGLEVLVQAGVSTHGLRPKSWREFQGLGAPKMDFVVTLSAMLDGEQLDNWPGRPVSNRLYVPDVVAARGNETERRRRFREAYETIGHELGRFVERGPFRLRQWSLVEKGIDTRMLEEETPVAAGDRVLNVLFLCLGNSARSIMAEAILNREGGGRFKAFSAGSQPAGAVNPHAAALLGQLNYKVDHLRSKSWEEFTAPDAPEIDFVFTVCDQAVREVCPVWPGQPMSAHWGLPDPVRVRGNEAEVRTAFAETYRFLNNRISTFVNLPFQSLDRLSLQKSLDRIGQSAPKKEAV